METKMNIILMVVTALALAMAAGMAVVVVTMLRHERARSDARIEALSALAAEGGSAAAEPVHASAHFAAEQVAQWREAVRPARESSSSLESAHRPARQIVEPIATQETSSLALDDVDDFDIRPSVAGVADLFAEPERPSPWANRLVAIGCFAAIVLAIGVGLTTFGSRNAPDSETTSTTTAKAKADIAPLELLSLRHTQEPDRIVITGLVQNPRAAAPIAHVAATVFVFGPGGALLSSNQAPLDYTMLAPGGESQFVVSVPVTGQVSRYRVGFRTEDGQVLPHVDKRAPDALAQK
jgi:hypothetical protein